MKNLITTNVLEAAVNPVAVFDLQGIKKTAVFGSPEFIFYMNEEAVYNDEMILTCHGKPWTLRLGEEGWRPTELA